MATGRQNGERRSTQKGNEKYYTLQFIKLSSTIKIDPRVVIYPSHHSF